MSMATTHREDCGCWGSGRPCFVDEWAEKRLGPTPSDWVFIVEMDGGQWQARRAVDGSLEYEHIKF